MLILCISVGSLLLVPLLFQCDFSDPRWQEMLNAKLQESTLEEMNAGMACDLITAYSPPNTIGAYLQVALPA